MRKIKIMLMSLLVLAVVGGALAFKAKFQKIYCTAPVPASGSCLNVKCPNVVESTTEGGTQNFCYTVPPAGLGCNPGGVARDCITIPTLFTENE